MKTLLTTAMNQTTNLKLRNQQIVIFLNRPTINPYVTKEKGKTILRNKRYKRNARVTSGSAVRRKTRSKLSTLIIMMRLILKKAN